MVVRVHPLGPSAVGVDDANEASVHADKEQPQFRRLWLAEGRLAHARHRRRRHAEHSCELGIAQGELLRRAEDGFGEDGATLRRELNLAGVALQHEINMARDSSIARMLMKCCK